MYIKRVKIAIKRKSLEHRNTLLIKPRTARMSSGSALYYRRPQDTLPDSCLKSAKYLAPTYNSELTIRLAVRVMRMHSVGALEVIRKTTLKLATFEQVIRKHRHKIETRRRKAALG